MITTAIGRNRKKLIEAIFGAARDVKCFCLENGFSGEAVDIAWVKKEFDQFNFAKLRKTGECRYSLRVHSNCWYEFSSNA